MAYTKSGMMQEIHEIHGLGKPSVSSLLIHIFSAAFSSGMITLLVFGSAVIAYLGHHDIPPGNCFALLIGTIIVLAFIRGCTVWQEDINAYQKALADARHTYEPHTG